MFRREFGYDRAITIFSPDGRLFQVEYARESIRKGWTTLGIRAKDGVVLVSERRKVSNLMKTTVKILNIDEHIGLTFAGLPGDARILIDKARIYAQSYRIIYDEPIPVEYLARKICDIKQAHTQYGGVRPFGVAFLFAGVDFNGPQLIGTEPGGSYFIYYAHAIGSGASTVIDFLEKNYSKDIDLESAIILGLKALNLAVEGGITSDNIEIGYIDVKKKIFRKISRDEIKKYVEKLRG